MGAVLKKTFFTLTILFATLSLALADWSQVFHDMYVEKGIDDAVVYALSKGNSPDQIMKTALPFKGLAQEELVKALFCALVPLDTVYNTAVANNIAEEKINAGYDLAVEQCPKAVEEKLNTAAPSNPAMAPSQNTNSSDFASPSTF